MSAFATESDRLIAVFEAGRAARLEGVRRLPDLIKAMTDLGYSKPQAEEAVKKFAEMLLKVED